jgi:hypothetical protein
MKNLSLILLLCTLLSSAAFARDNKLCSVHIPAGTSLTIRSMPNGLVVGKLENGTGVIIMDSKGKWVFVGDKDNSSTIGWIRRNQVICQPKRP